ncbi:MAG: ribonuclease HII [Bacteroidota bacterium]|nr:ribonuclease HII [Bacteroidota bacterium]MDX5429623.1 ribonuclease HII [Bacteroidota bacterium]MDX5468407.1 ribonuclease HII [Bacteroidota bacterium]
MLKAFVQKGRYEAGCDEAGRGCLAGPVFAAAVILPENYRNKWLNDSKQIKESLRKSLREEIESSALAWAVASCSPEEIDQLNILNASIEAMHRALRQLNPEPEYILVDGNRFKPFGKVPFDTYVKGDGRFLSIAAASILAKTYRDDYMERIHEEFPGYAWDINKGYPTAHHRSYLIANGPSPYHRKSFRLKELQQIQLPL